MRRFATVVGTATEAVVSDLEFDYSWELLSSSTRIVKVLRSFDAESSVSSELIQVMKAIVGSFGLSKQSQSAIFIKELVM